MKLNQILLILAISALSLIFSACEKQDAYMDWKVMNNDWLEANKNDKNSFPFNWTIDVLKTPLINAEFQTTESGIKYKILRLGNPADRMPNPTSYIWATYEGKLIDGTDFESQVDSYWDYLQNLPIGVQEILLKMHIGDIYEFYLPYTMAFGEKGDYKVPPYSTVIYRVELTDAKY